jgi:hypothetical protein
MSLRKQRPSTANRGGEHDHQATPPCPPEAFAYDDDVTPAAVQQLRDEAAETMSKGNWTVIDGYVGNNKPPSRVG